MDKQSKTLLSLIVFIGIIACLMLLAYIINFRYGFSDNSSDWGDFGAYMGSITGLLAFIGVLYTIRQSSLQSAARDDRDLFFKLMDEHRQTRDSLTFPGGDKKGIEAIDAYVENINKDFQLITILASGLGKRDFQAWTSSIYFKLGGHEVSAYNIVYVDLIIEILESISALQTLPDGKHVNLGDLHSSDPKLKSKACNACFQNIEELFSVFDKGDLDTDRFDYSDLPDAKNLALVARMIWWHKLDNWGRFRALEYTANVFCKKYQNSIIHYFSNTGYIIFMLNSFVKTNTNFCIEILALQVFYQ